jgi:hypothetical protein
LVKDWKEGQPTPEQCERAAVIRQWAIDHTETGDYMYNLRIAAKLPLATKHEGLLASLPNAYERAQGRKTERAARPVSEWLGEVGKRAEWTVTYNGYTAIDGNYGTTWIMRYTGPNGEKLVWFCSGSPKRPIEGSQIKLKATVKRHDFRKGEKQTIVSRGVMTFDDEPAATAAA